MESRKPAAAFALILAAGVAYLLDALFSSAYLEPCTSSGPAPSGPCHESLVVISSLAGIAITLVVLGLLVISFAKFTFVWSRLVILASAAGYVLLILLVINYSYAPALAAVPAFAILFLPGLLLGVFGGTAILRRSPFSFSDPGHSRHTPKSGF